MIDEHPLEGAWTNYQAGLITREALEATIFIHIRDYPGRFALKDMKTEERLDFLCGFYPQLKQAIDRYRPIGASFDAYLHTLIRYRSIMYRTAEAERIAIENCYWRTISLEQVHEPSVDYQVDQADELINVNPKRALMLALKCCYYVSDSFIEMMAKTLKKPKAELQHYFYSLRTAKAGQFARLRALEREISRSKFLCLCLTERLRISPEQSAHRRNLERSLRRAKRHIALIQDLYQRAPKCVSNLEVARLMGVPKGTVDYAMAAIKRPLRKLSEQASDN